MSNSTIDLLLSRRSAPPQTLTGPGPGKEEIETLLKIASRVPDHGKLAPWRFVIIEGAARERIGEVAAKLYAEENSGADDARLAAERGRFMRAPLVVAVVSRAAPHVKIPEWEQVLSAGAAAMNLVLAAHALGFGANWVTEWFAYDRSVLDALGLKPHERIAGFVHIGRPPGIPEDRQRPPLAEITSRFTG